MNPAATVRLRADFEALPPDPTPAPCPDSTPSGKAAQVAIYDPIGQARENPRSRALAVKAVCWDCVGAGVDPNPRREIGECRARGCPLWPVRPYQAEADGRRHLKRAVRERCLRCMGPDPGAPARVRECVIATCPIHGLRPYQRRSS